jgi:type I restriction enzyme R subunit
MTKIGKLEGFIILISNFQQEITFTGCRAMNQGPKQKVRYWLNKLLQLAGWSVQNKNTVNFNMGQGIAVREYQTDVGPADYVLFVDRQPVGIIEAKREEEEHRLMTVEDQSSEYASSKLKHLNNEPLPFVYESTGILTGFTDYRDPKPRSRPVFSFHRPEPFMISRGKDAPCPVTGYSVA